MLKTFPKHFPVSSFADYLAQNALDVASLYSPPTSSVESEHIASTSIAASVSSADEFSVQANSFDKRQKVFSAINTGRLNSRSPRQHLHSPIASFPFCRKAPSARRHRRRKALPQRDCDSICALKVRRRACERFSRDKRRLRSRRRCLRPRNREHPRQSELTLRRR